MSQKAASHLAKLERTTSHERFSKFERTTANLATGIRLPRLQQTPAAHKGRSLVTLPTMVRSATLPVGASAAEWVHDSAQAPPALPERQRAIEKMWTCADKIMRKAVTRRNRRESAPPDYLVEPPGFRCREPIVLSQPKSAAPRQPSSTSFAAPLAKLGAATVPTGAAPRRSRPERVYAGVRPAAVVHKDRDIPAGTACGFVAVDNESHKFACDNRHTQTQLLGRNIQEFQVAIEKAKQAKARKVTNALKIVGDSVLWSFFMYWRTVLDMSGGDFDVAGCLETVREKSPAYIKGAILWLKVYRTYESDQRHMLNSWAFGRWQMAATKMKLRKTFQSPGGSGGGSGRGAVSWTAEQMDVMMLMQDVLLSIHSQLDLTQLLENACALSKWLIRCNHAAVVLKQLDMTSTSCFVLAKVTGEILPTGHSLIHHSAETETSVLCNCVSADTMFNPLIDRSVADVNSMLLVPIQVPLRGLLGIMVLSKSDTGQFCASDQFMIELMMAHLAYAATKLLDVQRSWLAQEQMWKVLCAVANTRLLDKPTDVYRRMLTDISSVTGGRTCGLYLLKDDKLHLSCSIGGELPKTVIKSSETHGAWRKKKIQLHCDMRVAHTVPAICGEAADVLMMCSPILSYKDSQTARATLDNHLETTRLPNLTVEEMCKTFIAHAETLTHENSTGDFQLPALVYKIDPDELNMINENADMPERLIEKCQAAVEDVDGTMSLWHLERICKELIEEVSHSRSHTDGDSSEALAVLVAAHSRKNAGVLLHRWECCRTVQEVQQPASMGGSVEH